MNEEEKEAIEELNKRYDFFKNNILATNVWLTLDIHNLGILLNLIENQQKEIEEFKKVHKDIIKCNKRIYDVEIIENMCEELANSISKQKIKDKIEFINNLDEKLYYKENIIFILQELLEE